MHPDASVRHRLGDYQLDEAIIEDYFGEYIDYYGIERERVSLRDMAENRS
ncbi:MAG: hypothetical protein OXC05_12865 [Halieaceae bacterium]|nr:hypothetical protein [Halieaceae bacterium]